MFDWVPNTSLFTAFFKHYYKVERKKIDFILFLWKIFIRTWNIVNPFQPSVAFHIEISHLICLWKGTVSGKFRAKHPKLCGNCAFPQAKQITGFYMKRNTGLKWGKNFVAFLTAVIVSHFSRLTLISYATNIFE